MNNHTIIGAIKEKAGALEEGLGKVTGDTGTELRGQGRQIEGKVETMLGDVLDSARCLYEERPLVSLLALGSLALATLSILTRGNRA